MLCGIDEAGRGCIAGPLVLAGVIFNNGRIPEDIKDSKQLTETKRSLIAQNIKAYSTYKIVSFDNHYIDKYGLSHSIKNGLKQIMQNMNAKRFIFDGNCNFGIQGIETIVKADTKIKEVSAASILAKDYKDNLLKVLGKQFLQYDFASHKGYLTKKHMQELKQYGRCDLHRKSFNIKALEANLIKI